MEHTEFRKLQESKGGSYLITLPKDWVSSQRLGEEKTVRITEMDTGSLIIEPREPTDRPLEVEIELGERIESHIIERYLLGYDIIKIKSPTKISPRDRQRIKGMARRLIGLEIVEEAPEHMTLQCLLSPSALPVKSLIKRAYDVAAQMHEDVVSALTHNDAELARNVIERDEEVDRLYLLAVRQLRGAVREPSLAGKIGLSVVECLDYRTISSFIETIGDLAVGIAREILEREKEVAFKGRVLTELVQYSELIHDLHQKAMKALLTQDRTQAEKVIISREGLEVKRRTVSTVIAGESGAREISSLIRILLQLESMGTAAVDIASILAWMPEEN